MSKPNGFFNKNSRVGYFEDTAVADAGARHFPVDMCVDFFGGDFVVGEAAATGEMVEEGVVADAPFPTADVWLHAELGVDLEDSSGGAYADEAFPVAERHQDDMMP